MDTTAELSILDVCGGPGNAFVSDLDNEGNKFMI